VFLLARMGQAPSALFCFARMGQAPSAL
jgi:hypothetical protein